MEEATIVEWHRREGDVVAAGDIIVSIETDKATYEIEAPVSGVLHIAAAEGQEVAVETLIATIGDVAGAASQGAAPSPAKKKSDSPAAKPGRPVRGRVLASPKARRRADELGVDLASITPSAPDGMVSVEDVERAAAETMTLEHPAGEKATTDPKESLPGPRPIRERRRLAGLKKTAARRLQESWRTIPHIVQMVEVDATGLVAERRKLVASGMQLSLNDLVVHAAVRAMAAHPELNATVVDDDLLLYQGVDAGIAVDTPRGLMVPVIRGADGMDLAGLAAESRRLIEAAQSGRLAPENVGQASVTVSNLGMFGIQAGTPVINLYEPVLVFVGSIEERAAVVGGRVVARPTMTLSIAYDHRVADGVAAAAYTQALKREIEGYVQNQAEGGGPTPESGVGRREARSTSPGTDYAVNLNTAGVTCMVDEPEDEGGSGGGPSPVDALLGALLGCLTISFKFNAKKRGVPIERVDGWVASNTKSHLKEIFG
jgi:pyruvate/2-oxoglutarate dehydrogenase complex dihydrolipoamide acyltransferase (E2) component